MSEQVKDGNVCCPELSLLDCEDTDTHQHFYCDSKYVIDEFLISNIWVRNICMGNFRGCSYFPKHE